ncbi:MAG: hypothetical protein ACPL3E_02625, partial [Minisyncoccia bacterium]
MSPLNHKLQNNQLKERDNGSEFISLKDAALYFGYSQEYLNLRIRQGKLKAVKIGRNWATKKEWIDEYIKNVNDYFEKIKENNKREINYTVKNKIRKIFSVSEFFSAFSSLVLNKKFIATFFAILFIFSLSYLVFANDNIKSDLSKLVSKIFPPEDFAVMKNDFQEKIILPFNTFLNNTFSFLAQLGTTIDEANYNIFSKIYNTTTYSFGNFIETIRNLTLNFQKSITKFFVKQKNVFGGLFSFSKKENLKTTSKEKVIFIQPTTTLSQKEVIIPKIEKIIQVEPVKEVTKEIIKIDDKKLTEIENKISAFSNLPSEIENIRLLYYKIQPSPPNIITPTAPIYIGKTGLQVSGSGQFQTLGVTGITSLYDLSVGGSTILGTNNEDKLIINASSIFNSPISLKDTVTVGDNALTIDSSGNLTSLGNLKIGGDTIISGSLSAATTTLENLTVQKDANIIGNLSVSGAQSFFGVQSITASSTLPILTLNQLGTGPLIDFQLSSTTVFTILNNSNVGIGTTTPAYKLTLNGDLYVSATTTLGAVTSTPVIFGGYIQSNIIPYSDIVFTLGSPDYRWANIYAATTTIGGTTIIDTNTITANTTSTWKTVSGDLTIKTENGNLIFQSFADLTQQFGTSSGFALKQGANSRLAIDSSGNISANGTTINLAGNTIITGNTTTTGNVTIEGDLSFVGNRTISGTGTLKINPTGNLFLQTDTTYIDDSGNIILPVGARIEAQELRFAGDIVINASSTGPTKVIVRNENGTQVANLDVPIGESVKVRNKNDAEL